MDSNQRLPADSAKYVVSAKFAAGIFLFSAWFRGENALINKLTFVLPTSVYILRADNCKGNGEMNSSTRRKLVLNQKAKFKRTYTQSRLFFTLSKIQDEINIFKCRVIQVNYLCCTTLLYSSLFETGRNSRMTLLEAYLTCLVVYPPPYWWVSLHPNSKRAAARVNNRLYVSTRSHTCAPQ